MNTTLLIVDKHHSPTHWPLYLTKWKLDSGGGITLVKNMYVVRGVWGWPYYKAVTCMLVTRPRSFCTDIIIISCVVSMDTEQFVKF